MWSVQPVTNLAVLGRSVLAAVAVLMPALVMVDGGSYQPALLNLAAVGCVLAWYFAGYLHSTLKAQRTYRGLLFFIWGTMISVSLLGPGLYSRWGMIDDHEIVEMFDATGILAISDVSSRLSEHLEYAAPQADWPRYRPAYYAVRHLEAWAWGNRPQLWYAARLVMLSVSLSLGFYVLWAVWGVLWANLAIILMLTEPWMVDIWPRLGPSEQYAMLGTALFAAGVVHALRATRLGIGDDLRSARSSLALSWLVMMGGSLLAFGSKENFLVLLPACWLVAMFLARRQRLYKVVAGPALLIATAAGMWITWVVLQTLRHAKQDIYGGSVESGALMAAAKSSVEAMWLSQSWWCARVTAVVVLLAATASLVCVRRRRRKRTLLKFWILTLLPIAAFAILFVSQHVFYRGNIPSNSRYAFPADICMLLICLTAAAGFARLVHYWRFDSRRLSWVSLAVGCALFWMIWSSSPARLLQAAYTNQRETVGFTEWINLLQFRAKTKPEQPIVLFVGSVEMYEPAFSLERFLRSKQVTNPLYLHWNTSAPISSPAERDLSNTLRDVSRKGGRGFLPLSGLPDDTPLWGIGVGRGLPSDVEPLGYR